MRLIFLIIVFAYVNQPFFSDTFFIDYNDKDRFQLTMRSNVRIYKDGKYLGLYTSEQRGLLKVDSFDGDFTNIEGAVYRLQKGFRGKVEIGSYIDTIDKTKFKLNKSGEIVVLENELFPYIKGIPFFPQRNIGDGESWSNYGSTIVFLDNPNEYQIIKIYINFVYRGKQRYQERLFDYFEISFGYYEPLTKGSIIKVSGLHKMRLFFDNELRVPVFMDEHFEDTIVTSDRGTYVKKGFNLYFYKSIELFDRPIIIAELKNLIGHGDGITDKTISNTDDSNAGSFNSNSLVSLLKTDSDNANNRDQVEFSVAEKEEGISVTINNLNFLPNSVELVQGEENSLERLIGVLKGIEKRTIMVVGHTARSGSQTEQMRLSTERAKTIAGVFISKGIDKGRILFTGKGADEPVAPNDSEENMRKNRRVEIIILED